MKVPCINVTLRLVAGWHLQPWVFNIVKIVKGEKEMNLGTKTFRMFASLIIFSPLIGIYSCSGQSGAVIAQSPGPFPRTSLRSTNQPLDLAVDNSGQNWPSGYEFLMLKDSSGATVLTLSESFKANEQGLLVNSLGETLFPPITVPMGAEVAIHPDGRVTAIFRERAETREIGQIYTTRVVSPFSLPSFGPGRLRLSESSPEPPMVVPGTQNASKVLQGYLDSTHQ